MRDDHESQRFQLPLLEPKLYPPRLHAGLVERKRLLEKLDAILEYKLTLLCAPAGCGKTTLIGQWVENSRERGQGSPVAWLALESSDNDPLRFWRYIMSACQVFYAESEHDALARLIAELPPFEMPSLEKILTLLLNSIVRFAGNGILILEDYHLITDPHIHETMTFFLEHLPPQIRVVVLARCEPPLPLARWRARGDLYELPAAELRFLQEEIVDFFQHISPTVLPAAALNQLEKRVEGWAAGLRLLALALQRRSGQQDVEHLLATFAGEQRSLQDYFVAEVLCAQPEHLQDFLLRTSILGRLEGSLCDAVVERYGSQLLLEDIEKAGIFLESLDNFMQPLSRPTRAWYRYHALFAEAMQAEARRRLGEDTLCGLALKASRWYERQGMFVEAVEAAFQAQDTKRAAELIERILDGARHFILGPRVFQEINGFHTLRRWLERLPETTFRERPLLSLGYAIALLLVLVVEQPPPAQAFSEESEGLALSYQALLTKIEVLLHVAEEGFRAIDDLPKIGAVLAFHALIAREQGALREAVGYARESLAWLPENDREWRNLSLNVIGMGKLVDGQLEEAQKIFLELCALCEIFGNRALLRANSALLNLVSYEQGHLRQAAEFFHQMYAEAREEDDHDDIAHSSLLLAWLSYEWNNLQEAEQQAQETLRLGQQIGNEEFQIQAELVLARVEHARGQKVQAQQRCLALLARFPAISPLRYRLCREIQGTQAGFSLTLGDLVAVERWRTHNPPDEQLPRGQFEREALLVARWQLAKKQGLEALHLLTPLLDTTQHMGRTRSALEIQAVIVLARQTCGHHQEARQALRALLACARSEGYLRLFLDEGAAMVALLRVTIPQLGERALIAYAQGILRAADPARVEENRSPAYTLLADPLSPQEQRVLRLLLAGHSNPEIARDLVVSVNTVKVHLKNMYRKLNVSTRLEACKTARHLDFL